MPLDPLVWNNVIPGLGRLEGLYLEFIEVHVQVLQSMTQLAKLRYSPASVAITPAYVCVLLVINVVLGASKCSLGAAHAWQKSPARGVRVCMTQQGPMLLVARLSNIQVMLTSWNYIQGRGFSHKAES